MDLSTYEFSSLREGQFTLHRGLSDRLEPILLVACADEHPSRASLHRLEHEHALGADLDPEWAVRPVDLVRREGRLMLVLEDPGGEPLERRLGRPLAMTDSLVIAVALAAAIGRMHARGFVHRDLKPANILVAAARGGVRLTGFGIASRLPRERQTPGPPEGIAGTLAYMAPEQTGRMNRSTDSRSDLYSFGVTLYEMLTGALPFSAAEPMEWIHCHIARQPMPPSERANGIPDLLSAIVMKLLEKSAEDRYQTAAGLEADLRRCQLQWEAHGRIEPFPLGLQDTSDRLLIPERLYGREREVDILLAAFDRVVADGATELVLVSGYSGIGKSSVINELHKALVPPRAQFAAGKFDQYNRDIPYATLAQAFQSLVRRILGQSGAELERWRGALLEALGANAGLMVNLVPDLELVIGKPPPVAELPPQDAKNRFQTALRRFLGVFARAEHPLALFLDDLQWLDAATLDVIDQLVTHSEIGNLLLIGAYRDNEVGPEHPLRRTLQTIRDPNARVREVVLAPLGIDDVERLVADAVHCESERARPLAQLVHEKTGGNPFFAIQFLTALNEEGLLTFDMSASTWQWDIDRIHAKNYTDNVVSLMVGRLKLLSANTQEAVKQLACLGNAAEIAVLTMIDGVAEAALHAVLWEAVVAGLLLREDGAYKFLHDRIQQAAYSLVPDERRADIHLRIGRLLLERMSSNQLAEHLFEVANQFNRASGTLIDRDEKVRVAALHLRAGRKAKASAAYGSARAYFAAGIALLDESDWLDHYELTFRVWLERAECEFLSSNFDTAEQLIEEIIPRSRSKLDQADVYKLKLQLHIVRSENTEAVDSALTCLRWFGVDLPVHPTWEQVQAEYQTLWNTLDGRPPHSLIDLPLMSDPEMQAALQVLSILTAPAYFTDFQLFCFIACRMAQIGINHGMGDASPLGYALLGFVIGPVFHRYGEDYQFAKLACKLVEKHNFVACQAKVFHAAGTVAFWTQPIVTAIDFMRAAFRAATETGDLTFACYGLYQIITGLLLRNDPLDEVWRESQLALDFIQEAKYGDPAEIVRSQQRFIANMQGRTATFSTFSDAQFDESQFEARLTADRMSLMVCFYWILKLKARFLSGDYAEALAAADKAKPLLSIATAQIQLLDYFYYTALTVVAVHEGSLAGAQSRWRDVLATHQEQLREWADNHPATFIDKYALVSAEIARLEGRDVEAMRLYEQAIRSAHDHGFIQNEGVGFELAARFYSARGFNRIASVYLTHARYCYLHWGAEGKVRQLDQLYPHVRGHPAPSSTLSFHSPLEQLDVGAVIKSSQALSGEIFSTS